MDPAISVAIVVVCVAMSAFFSGSETALLRLRSHELEEDVRSARGPAAIAVRDLIRSTSRLLVTILLGNNVVNILASGVAAALAVSLLGERYGIVVSTLVMTAIILIFAEILPKAAAARHPRGIAYAVGLPLYLFHAVLRPVHRLFDRVIEPLLQRMVGRVEGEEATSVEEVLRLARSARDGSGGGTSPLTIMGAAAGAADMTVSEIMVPRTEIVAFSETTAPADLLEKVLQERYTRVLVFKKDIDHVLGVIHLKDLIQLVRREGDDLGAILKPVLRVPERKPILLLLSDMQRAFVHVAVVKDEFGVTQGLVTQEDILEEIVGEIRDEFDHEELLTIREFPDGSYQALGRVKVLDFNRETGWDIPAERGDTLSGLVFNELGRAPRKGDSVTVPGYVFSVADISGTRITQVRVYQVEDETAPEPESD
jgi:CBS domain containing-hemolysin-like protein